MKKGLEAEKRITHYMEAPKKLWLQECETLNREVNKDLFAEEQMQKHSAANIRLSTGSPKKEENENCSVQKREQRMTIKNVFLLTHEPKES